MAVKRLRQVFVVPGDLDAAASFYEQTLGLSQQFRDGDNWVQFGAGDVSFALASETEGQGAPAGVAIPVFEVDNLEETLAAATAGGATAAAVRDMGDHGRTVLVTDPTGARISLFQR